jgi:hypothetical protein
MMRRLLVTTAASVVLLMAAVMAQAQQIQGDYVESRTADVYAGYCFANSETGLTGNQAILGWRVRAGEWDGVNLEGLSVVGVVRAGATLGDPFGNPYPAKAMLVVDARANEAQRAALISFARNMAGELFSNIIAVESAPIRLDVIENGGHSTNATLVAGSFAGVTTRAIADKDLVCGHEDLYYQPLARTVHAMPAVAEVDRYSGQALGVTWSLTGKRSAFVATFNVADTLRP